MIPKKKVEDPGFIFMANERYVIGSPNSIAASEESIDITVQKLADKYDLQDKLCLATRNFSKATIPRIANYLSAFESDPIIKNQKQIYLNNNGQLRIIITDATLKEEVRNLNI